MPLIRLTATTLLCLVTLAATAADSSHSHDHGSAYAGQEQRRIKSLSPDDLAELKRGGGWGLAKAAELNGVPGPAHLLEMKDAIHLSPDQIKAIEAVFESMRVAAVAEGKTLIALETRLEDAFRDRSIDDASLQAMLRDIADSRMRLRHIHLSAHLKTPALLREQQIAHYNALRGYGNNDPCLSVPEGHNAEMWRKHNGCD